jgi:hypothetical protein
MKQETIIQQRLRRIAKELELSDRAFGLSCNCREDLINKTGKTISNEVVWKIYQAYPNINLYWLLFGEGDNIFLGDDNLALNRFFMDEFKHLKVENRQLIEENAVLKSRLSALHTKKNQD